MESYGHKGLDLFKYEDILAVPMPDGYKIAIDRWQGLLHSR
jgi:hypothetical protein